MCASDVTLTLEKSVAPFRGETTGLVVSVFAWRGTVLMLVVSFSSESAWSQFLLSIDLLYTLLFFFLSANLFYIQLYFLRCVIDIHIVYLYFVVFVISKGTYTWCIVYAFDDVELTTVELFTIIGLQYQSVLVLQCLWHHPVPALPFQATHSCILFWGQRQFILHRKVTWY